MKNIARSSDRVYVFFLVFFSFLVLPLSFTTKAMDPTFHIGYVIWSFLCVVLGICLFTENAQRPFAAMARRKIFWAGGIYLLAATLSVFGSMNFGEGFFAWSKIILAGIFFLMCAVFFESRPQYLIHLSRWATVSGFCLVFLGLAGRYWQDGTGSFLPPVLNAMMINKNLYASALFLLIPFTGYSLFLESSICRKAAAFLLPALVTVSLLSLSRAIWLAMILPCIPVMILGFRYVRPRPSMKITAVFLILFIIIFIGGLRLLPLSAGKSESIQLRLSLWKSSVNILQDNMVFGAGPGQWRLVLPRYAEPLGLPGNIEMHAQRPHNDFLWVASEIGMIGVTAYLTFFAILLYYVVKTVRIAPLKQKILALFMLYGISGYLVIAMFSFPRERSFHSLLIILMAAVVVSVYHRLYPSIPFFSISDAASAIGYSAIIIFCACFCLNNGLRLFSEIQVKKALTARAKGEWQQVIAHIDKAVLPVYTIDPFGVPLFWYRGMAHYQAGNLAAARDDFSRALQHHPYHDYSYNNLAEIKKRIKNL